MSERSCSIPTPEQRAYLEFREMAEKAMLETIYKAIDEAAMSMAKNVEAAGIDISPTDGDYFMFAAQT